MSCGGLEALNPVCQLQALSTTAITRIATAAFDAIAAAFASVATDAVNWLWGQLSSATTITLSGPGFASLLAATGAIALVVTTVLFLVQLITSAIRREPGGLGRALTGLVVSFLGAAFAVATTAVLLSVTDALSSGVVAVTLDTNLQGLGEKLVAVAALGVIAPAATLLISLALLVAVVVVWAALLVRKLLVIVAAVFAPIAFAGASADVTRGWVRRWIEFTVALVTSKLVLVMIFMIGLAVLDGAGGTGSGATESVTQLLTGTLLLVLGGFAPFMALRLVHFAGDGLASLHGHAAVATAGARQAVAAPQKLASAAQRVEREFRGAGVAGMFGAAGGAAAGAGVDAARARPASSSPPSSTRAAAARDPSVAAPTTLRAPNGSARANANASAAESARTATGGEAGGSRSTERDAQRGPEQPRRVASRAVDDAAQSPQPTQSPQPKRAHTSTGDAEVPRPGGDAARSSSDRLASPPDPHAAPPRRAGQPHVAREVRPSAPDPGTPARPQSPERPRRTSAAPDEGSDS